MFVQRRNEKLVENAARSNALVSSLFPRTIRERFVEQNNIGDTATTRVSNLKAFLNGEDVPNGQDFRESNAIADLFVDTTVMFAGK